MAGSSMILYDKCLWAAALHCVAGTRYAYVLHKQRCHDNGLMLAGLFWLHS